MQVRRILALLCAAASAASLAAAYCMIGAWWGAGPAVLPCLLPLVHNRKPVRWLPHLYLACALCASAAGILAGAAPQVMRAAAALALAAWDFMNLGVARMGRSAGKRHVRSLALALGLGVLAAEGGAMLSMTLPFPIMLLLVVLIFFCLIRAFRSFAADRARHAEQARR